MKKSINELYVKHTGQDLKKIGTLLICFQHAGFTQTCFNDKFLQTVDALLHLFFRFVFQRKY